MKNRHPSAALAEAIGARMEALRTTPTQVAADSGIAASTVRGIKDGRIPQARHWGKLMSALEWSSSQCLAAAARIEGHRTDPRLPPGGELEAVEEEGRTLYRPTMNGRALNHGEWARLCLSEEAAISALWASAAGRTS